ncbi:Glycosyl hydrolase-like 10 [Thalassobacillus cyri]|uniref:Glycosyl hydrolase-like 10 n=1 Tax=Thalassobacillus cyri TaxID=571932 RepID=A0A1H3VRQ1_9BACI|nr:alpha amylase family protein [Thalassobacillus cyri]SDZ77505.1 Glycosyl hydrolase-like 10 [Thalassobacillus cyri]
MKKWFVLLLTTFLVLVSSLPTFAASDKSRTEVLKSLVDHEEFEGRVLWYDLSANINNLSSPEKVKDIVTKTADANIDTIILDVKNYTGFVGYNSEIAPHMSTSTIKNYHEFPEGYDLLQTVIEEAHDQGIEVHANVNVFSEGNNNYKDGPAFDNPEWQTQFYMANRILKTSEGETYDITGINKERGTNQLVVFTPDQYEVSPSNQWGVEVQVVDGVITEIRDRISGAEPLEVPDNGVVLSAHGDARTWVLNSLEEGETVDYNESESKIVPASEYPTFSTFVNPIREDVKSYEISIIEEIITNYDVDGIVLDRARYSNQYADFSDLSKNAFEEYIGEEVQNWPEDIFEIELTETGEEINKGKWYKEWIEFRAHNIQSFFKQAEEFVHDYDEDLFFSTYVGAWYPLYYSEGVNWASQTYQPDYDWASDDYHETGYAEYLDFLMTGNYFTQVTRDEAVEAGNPDWYSVEGSADIAMDVVNEATLLYGSLYLQQYEGDPEQFRKALRSVLERTHGIMLFDLVYLEQYEWWDILEEEFSEKKKSPHQNPGIMNLVRGES